MKKYLKVLFIIFIFITFFCLSYFRIEKTAIELSKVEDGLQYVIVKKQYSTSGVWSIIGDNNGLFNESFDASLKGNIPNINYDLQSQNIFICYGEYLPDNINLAGYVNKVFKVQEWDILYPVVHNSIFEPILPKRFLYSFECK